MRLAILAIVHFIGQRGKGILESYTHDRDNHQGIAETQLASDFPLCVDSSNHNTKGNSDESPNDSKRRATYEPRQTTTRGASLLRHDSPILTSGPIDAAVGSDMMFSMF